VLYLEGSDQHRGWFHSSLLESCGTRGHAPYDAVLTHGFTMAEDGRKMSKSLGNQVFPQDIIKQYGADILRLWVASCDYCGRPADRPEIIKTSVDSYRKLRNTLRWMLGSLAHATGEEVALGHAGAGTADAAPACGTRCTLVRQAYGSSTTRRSSTSCSPS
jgi:isoleucyl-tRNA synthetase